MMIRKLINSLIHKNDVSSERPLSDRLEKESDEMIEPSFNVHNQCLIGEDLNSSICTNETNYNWCKMSHESGNEMNNKMNSINGSDKSANNSTVRKKNCMMECFNDAIEMNVSGISRRRILANIDYDVDGQFMCSTLIKDAKEENDDGLKAKFHRNNHHKSIEKLESTSRLVDEKSRSVLSNNLINERDNKTSKLSNHKLDLISKQMQEAETVKQMKMYRNSLVRNPKSTSHKKSTPHTSNRKLDEELIYDSRKPFSDLSSIEETRLDNLRNNLKSMQMNSIDKRRIMSKYFDEDCQSAKLNRLIEHENLRSEMYNSENSNFINQIKQIQNYQNNQIVHDLNDENTWFCKTKLYDETLDSIVRKWSSLGSDSEIWCKIICCERNRVVAKAYIRLPYFIVGTVGSNILFDGYTVGLNGTENIYRDQETDFIVKNLDKGVRIKIDEEGNLLIRKMTHLSVQIKDWMQQLTEGQGALSDDIILCNGKIPFNKPVKVFDIDRFANNLRRELEKPYPNRRRLAKQCIVAISFGKSTYNVLNSPSWLMVVNVHALRMIEKAQRIYLPEPDYCLSTIDDNLNNQVCLKEDEESSSSSCSNGLDSMNSNSEDSHQYYSSSGFVSKNIYSSI